MLFAIYCVYLHRIMWIVYNAKIHRLTTTATTYTKAKLLNYKT